MMRTVPGRSAALAVVVASVALMICACGLPQGLQDRLDQRRLRRRFGIPRGAELISYEGYPSMVGFGQREGLRVSAVYRLTDEQESSFVSASLAGEWRRLPMQDVELARARSYAGDVPLALSEGIYLARTAGDDALRARETLPVSEVEHPSDVIIGVLDSETNRLYVRIASGY
jgi:hypothetical protein